MKELLPDVPVRAVVQVRQDEGDEVVVLLAAAPHDLVDAEQALDGLLPDNVLAVGQLFDDQRDVAAEDGVAKAPAFVLRQLLLQEPFVPLSLLGHPDQDVQYVERVEDDLEVLVGQQLEKEVEKPLGADHHVLRIALSSLLDVVEHLVDSLRANPPIVLGVHHPLDLLGGDELLLGRSLACLSLLLALLVHLEVVVVDVCGEANVTHRGEHLVLD